MTQNGKHREDDTDTLTPVVLRSELAPLEGKRIEVTAVYDRMGSRKNSSHGEKVITALVQCVEYEGKQICDHVHVQRAETIDAMHLSRGTLIRFLGVVMSYRKYDSGLCRWVEDYTLWNPTAVTVLRDRPVLPMIRTGEDVMNQQATEHKTLPDFRLELDNLDVAWKDGIEYVTAGELGRRLGLGTKVAGSLRVKLERAGVAPAFEYVARGGPAASKFYLAKEAMAAVADFKPRPRKEKVLPSLPKEERAVLASIPEPVTQLPPTTPKTDKATLVTEVQRLVEVYGVEAVKKALTFVAD